MGIVIPIITDFNGSGINRATKSFQQLETTGQKAAFAVRKAAVPAGIALVALAGGAIAAANASMQDQAAQDQLSRSLDKTTTASDGAIRSVDAWISSTSRATSVADDELRPALATLARGTGDLAKAQDGLKIALDVSAATGKPLATVSAALSKAYAGNATALGKLDPHVKAMIKNGASADQVIAAMAGRFKGDAAASADTAAGKMKGFGIAIDETKEAIGGALMPVVNAVLPLITAFGQWAQDNSFVFVVLAGVIGGVALAIMGANFALTLMTLNPVVLTIIAIVAACTALAIGFKLLWDHSDRFRQIMTASWEAIKAAVSVVVDYLKGPVMAAWDIIRGAFDAISALIRGDFSGAWDGLKTMIGGVVDWIKSTLLALPLLILGYAIDIGMAIVNGIASGVATLAEMTWAAIKELPGALLTLAAGWLEGLKAIGSAVIGWISSGITGLAAAAWENISGFASVLWQSFLTVAGTIKEWGSTIIGWIVSTATGLGASIWDNISGFPGVVWTELKKLAGEIKGWGVQLVQWVIDGIGSLPNAIGKALFSGVDSGGTGAVPPSMRANKPHVKVPIGATGGIVTRATLAMIGEAGPEAVIPLNSTPGSSALGGMGGITINVQAGLVSTPAQIGQQIIEAIQTAQRNSGPVFAAA